MAKPSADIIVETLLDRDVDAVFRIPSGGTHGTIESLRKSAENPLLSGAHTLGGAGFVSTGVRDEETAGTS